MLGSFFMFPGDVLHHHDGVVGDQSDGRGDPAERHQIDGLSERSPAQSHHGHGEGNRGDADQGQPPVAEEHQKDQTGEQDPIRIASRTPLTESDTNRAWS